MNKNQRQRCLRLADYLENKVTDDEYNHRFYKSVFNDGRVAYCAAGFAVANKKLFPGLKIKFSIPMRSMAYDCNVYFIEGLNDDAFLDELINYFSDDAWSRVFAGWNTDWMNRKLAIETLRSIAA
jgi:hypothetical protein